MGKGCAWCRGSALSLGQQLAFNVGSGGDDDRRSEKERKDKKKKEKREREVYEKDEGIVSKKKRLDSDEVDEMNVSDF